MSRFIVALTAFLMLLAVATPAQAGGGLFGRQVVRQRVVVQQQVVRQKVVQQVVVAHPVVQQVVVAQPIVAAYSQQFVYPQAQIVAPVCSQQIVGGGCAAFFAR